MLFSDLKVANLINSKFEPCWQSVRPVPMVRIDFGNGMQVVRTLHGNIATYVCAPDGQVLDILPGIYAPEPYQRALASFALLPGYLVTPDSSGGPSVRLVKYHETQARLLAEDGVAGQIVASPMDQTKLLVEGRIKYLLSRSAALERTSDGKPPAEMSASELANWSALVEDTRVNERVRRLTIHEKLAACGPVRPDGIKKWLYKEVLHADLDDPYLGLGPTLFASYPFADGHR